MKKVALSMLIVCFVWIGLVSNVYAQSRKFLIISDESTLEFSFKSTLHPVKGVARKFSGELIFENVNNLDLKSGKVIVASAQLDSQNKKRDHNMYKMFEINAFPQIVYEINKLVNIKKVSSHEYKGMFKGDLTIKAVKKNVDIDVIIHQVDDGYILEGGGYLSLKALDLKPPSVLGIIRVFDTVKINFKIHIT